MATSKSRVKHLDPSIWDMVQKGIYAKTMYHINHYWMPTVSPETYNHMTDKLWGSLRAADNIRTTLINMPSALTMRNH